MHGGWLRVSARPAVWLAWLTAIASPMADADKRRIEELELLVANLEAEKLEADQQAASRRAERMAERAAEETAAPVAAAEAPPAAAAPEAAAATGPLAGVRVVECTHFIAGPLSGRLLADQGVRVADSEPPGLHPCSQHPSYHGTHCWLTAPPARRPIFFVYTGGGHQGRASEW